MSDSVNHPKHYKHPSGAECIDIAEWFPFNLGNAIKYIWRAGIKSDRLEDLRKARWYVDREIAREEEQRKRAAQVFTDPIMGSHAVNMLVDGWLEENSNA